MLRLNIACRYVLVAAAGVLALVAAAALVAADHGKVVDGVAIYFGVVPSEVIVGHPKGHEERAMHGGAPGTAHRHHVVVALFDEATGRRVENAKVSASVTEPGRASQDKALDPMTIAGTLTYGNYFTMSGRGPYRIRVSATLPGFTRPYVADFDYRHTPP